MTTKLLVVEDHEIIVIGLQSALQPAPPAEPRYEFVIANLLAIAHAAIDESIDLILLDLSLPDADLHDPLAGLRMLYPRAQETPIIIFSATESPALIREALGAGAAGFIPKCMKMGIVVAAIDMVLKGGVYLPPHLMSLLASLTEPATADHGPPHMLAGVLLTHRQQSVLALLLEGQSNKEIARALGLSVGTVKNYVSALLRSANVKTRTQILATLHSKSGTH